MSGSGDGSNSDSSDDFSCPEIPNNPTSIFPVDGIQTTEDDDFVAWSQGTDPNTFCRQALGDPGGDCQGCTDCQGNCLP